MERMTIDRLAREAGMTVRNVRAHQTRGLLPPPRLVGRTGYYGPEHLARLRLIKDLQASDFNLGAIKRLLDAAPAGAGEELLAFEQALLAPWGPEEPEVFEAAELQGLFGDPPSDIVERAAELGLIVPLEDGRVEVPTPTLVKAGRELTSMGVPPEQLLGVLEALLQNADGIARRFVELFVQEVWRPFQGGGGSTDEWAQVRRSLERLRPLAAEALMAVFQRTMQRAVEEAFGREMERRAPDEEAVG
jgi:DNA-binding transcriptional MerR regulator